MKQIKKIFFVVTITIGSCMFSGFIVSKAASKEIKSDILHQIKNDPAVTRYIEESVDHFKSKSGEFSTTSFDLYALVISFKRSYLHWTSRLGKIFHIMKYYGIGQFLIFREYIKKFLFRAKEIS